MKSFMFLILSILLPLGAGFIGSYFTTPSIQSWYLYINKPPFNPPNWVFGPVWTVLYILMGISFYLYSKSEEKTKKGYIFYFIQLVLNTLWSILFFGLQNPLLGLIEIVILLVFIILTAREFRIANKTSALLLLPYLAWVSFASILNLSIFLLNR
mgnify:CR=1 FL=1